MDNGFTAWVHTYGKRHFRSYEWDSATFTAIGRTGITHAYDRAYLAQLYSQTP